MAGAEAERIGVVEGLQDQAEPLAPKSNLHIVSPEIPTDPRLDATGRQLHDALYPGHHLNNAAGRQTILQFSNEENKGDVDVVYDEYGNFLLYGEDDIRDEDGNPNYYSMPVFAARAELMKRVNPLLRLNDRRLRKDKPEIGFNRHDLEGHIHPSGKLIDQLLMLGGHSERIAFLAHQTNLVHDLGNLKIRTGHSKESMPLAVAVAPSITQDWKGFLVTERAAEYHDERALRELFVSWGDIDDKEKIERFEKLGEEDGIEDELPQVAAIMILADKADVDRARQNEAALNGQALASDVHARVIALSKNGGFSLSPDGTTLIHRVYFNPTLSAQEYAKRAAIARKRSHDTGHKINVPQIYTDLYEQRGIPDLYQFAADYKNIYAERIAISTLMAPIAVPGVRRFTLEFHQEIDPDEPLEGNTVRSTFSPNLLGKHGDVFNLNSSRYRS